MHHLNYIDHGHLVNLYVLLKKNNVAAIYKYDEIIEGTSQLSLKSDLQNSSKAQV